MPYLVIIGDVVASRAIGDRAGFQGRMRRAMDDRNAAQAEGSLVSPYTLTLGDEFQVVRSWTEGCFRDLLSIAADLQPADLRFALGIGDISTAINPAQAIGMDGSAFHRARDGVERLKQERAACRVEGLPQPLDGLVNNGLALAFGRLGGARGNRWPLAAALLEGLSVPQIAPRLGKSEQALYKTMRALDLQALVNFLRSVETVLGGQLHPPAASR
jgi:hypothetical protein